MLNQPLLRKSYLQLVCNLLIYIGVGCAKIIITKRNHRRFYTYSCKKWTARHNCIITVSLAMKQL